MSRPATIQSVTAMATLFAILVSTFDLTAQRRRRTPRLSPHSRNVEKIRSLLRKPATRARLATVCVVCDEKQVALGTVVSKGGLILTKASLLRGDVKVEFAGGQVLPATRVGADDANDLALLRVASTGLRSVDLAIDNQTKTGSVVITPGLVEIPIAYGVMSVARHPRKLRTLLGVTSEPRIDGLLVTKVFENTAAADAGLAVDDLVIAVEGKLVTDLANFRAAIGRSGPGVDLHLKIRRDDKDIEVVARPRLDDDRHGTVSSQERSRLWGPLSDVRLGFAEVIQHDTVIKPNQCGGPLVNLRGEVVGINIARVGRFESVAVTSKVVAKVLAEILRRPKK